MTTLQTQPEQAPKRRNWFVRHPLWTFVLILAAIVVVFAGSADPAADMAPKPAEPAAEPEPEPVAEEPAPEPEPEHDEFTAAVMCEEFVRDNLKAPATAGFPLATDYTIEHKGNGRYRMDSHVDSENGFGAQIRTEFTCKIQHAGGDQWELVDLTFEE
jgi:hypothetical protein